MLFPRVAKFMRDDSQYLLIVSLMVLQKFLRKLDWVLGRGSIRVKVARLRLDQRNFWDIVTNSNGQSINFIFKFLFVIWERYIGCF